MSCADGMEMLRASQPLSLRDALMPCLGHIHVRQDRVDESWMALPTRTTLTFVLAVGTATRLQL